MRLGKNIAGHVQYLSSTACDLTSFVGHQDMRDEHYIITLCDELLGREAVRQHHFSFLLGDSGRMLPVDAFYPDLKLVIEYRERQHSEPVAFFDRKATVSGVARGLQRALYDQRRRDILRQNGIALVELCYSEFSHTKGKRLLRNREEDLSVLRMKLQTYIAK